MCCRYVSPDTASIEREWHIGRGNSNPFQQRFNVLPTTQIPILRHSPESGEIELTEARTIRFSSNSAHDHANNSYKD
jgi:putative SOS response-associated peptidase YedK